jgi:hypothetical protein
MITLVNSHTGYNNRITITMALHVSSIILTLKIFEPSWFDPNTQIISDYM